MTSDSPLYQDDLAAIHIEGFGFHWEQAAPAVLGHLRAAGCGSGHVVDLGCGGGQWLARLADDGYRATGVDVSRAMLKAARRNAPAARLLHGSLPDVVLPACDAVTSLGEPVNYLDGERSIRRVFANVFEALRPGGVFVFDAREPAPAGVAPRVSTWLEEDWACIARITEDGAAGSIVREITTFRRHGRSFRRAEERHRLRVFPKRETLRWLRGLGFTVRSYRSYGDYRLAPRSSAYVARKPAWGQAR